MRKRVLVVGSGGREHALAWKLSQSSEVDTVWVAPGNDGMSAVAQRVDARDDDAVRTAASELQPDLVVVGPEAPLVSGLADALREDGLAVFGPSAAAARLEGDKVFAKEFMKSAGIRTARAESFDDLAGAFDYLKANPGPCVVKAAGLAAGKGVTVCDDVGEAGDALREILQARVFGDAGTRVLIEERLSGPELSVFAVLDGQRMSWFTASRDHKRLLDADRGPNTGGMGAYTPVRDADGPMMTRIADDVLAPTLAELDRRQLDYRGLLYVGLMLTDDGPSVLEFNARFGDPETQVVLPACPDDLYPVLEGAAQGRLAQEGPLTCGGAAVGIVLASEGYPSSPVKGRVISGLDSMPEGALVFHAGTKRTPDGWVTAGGRVLSVVARGRDVHTAREAAMAFAETIHFDGAVRRTDIASTEASS